MGQRPTRRNKSTCSTLDLYGLEANKKQKSYGFNTEPAWAKFLFKEKFKLVSG
jgi:hypothetical protein